MCTVEPSEALAPSEGTERTRGNDQDQDGEPIDRTAAVSLAPVFGTPATLSQNATKVSQMMDGQPRMR